MTEDKQQIKYVEGVSEVTEGKVWKVPMVCKVCEEVAVYTNDVYQHWNNKGFHIYCYNPVTCSKCKMENICD